MVILSFNIVRQHLSVCLQQKLQLKLGLKIQFYFEPEFSTVETNIEDRTRPEKKFQNIPGTAREY